MARTDWANKIDWEAAAANVTEDAKGDWYRDPWGWPEYAYVLASDRETIMMRARASGVKRAARIDVPKGNFATRPAIVLEPLDRLVLQGLTDFISAKLIGKLPPWVYGWRRPRKDPKPHRYTDNEQEWDSYRSHLKSLVRVYDIALRADIVSCFASIPVDRACEDIEHLSGRNEVSGRIIDMLTLYGQIPGRSGIPQRSLASCVIANMYLGRLDKVLSDYSASRSGIFARLAHGDLVVRWMDDFWIFGSKEAPLRAVPGGAGLGVPGVVGARFGEGGGEPHVAGDDAGQPRLALLGGPPRGEREGEPGCSSSSPIPRWPASPHPSCCGCASTSQNCGRA